LFIIMNHNFDARILSYTIHLDRIVTPGFSRDQLILFEPPNFTLKILIYYINKAYIQLGSTCDILFYKIKK
jgi:hypothetical protein